MLKDPGAAERHCEEDEDDFDGVRLKAHKCSNKSVLGLLKACLEISKLGVLSLDRLDICEHRNRCWIPIYLNIIWGSINNYN